MTSSDTEELDTGGLRAHELRALEARYSSLKNEPYRVIRAMTKFVVELLDISEADAEQLVLGKKTVKVIDLANPQPKTTKERK